MISEDSIFTQTFDLLIEGSILLISVCVHRKIISMTNVHFYQMKLSFLLPNAKLITMHA